MTDSWVSPNYKYSNWIVADTDKKIEIFQDRVNGWMLDIAKQCNEIPHSGFAVLSIILSYFEMIGAFNKGDTDHTGSNEFKDGIRLVFQEFKNHDSELGELYRLCRCGMYHIGMVREGILLDNYDKPLSLENNVWKIDPAKLVERITEHFNNDYLNQIRTNKTHFQNTIKQVIPDMPTSNNLSSYEPPTASGVLSSLSDDDNRFGEL